MEKDFSLFDVYGADEAFVTGTFGGLTTVVNIDGRIVGEGAYGKICQQLSKLYEALIDNEVKYG